MVELGPGKDPITEISRSTLWIARGLHGFVSSLAHEHSAARKRLAVPLPSNVIEIETARQSPAPEASSPAQDNVSARTAALRDEMVALGISKEDAAKHSYERIKAQEATVSSELLPNHD